MWTNENSRKDLDLCSLVRSYCGSHSPQSTSKAFLYWCACSTELKTRPIASDAITGKVSVVSFSKFTVNTYVFSPRVSKHIPHDSWSFCAVTRERGVNTFHDSWSFCAVTRERGVNTFRMTHDLLRSYSRMWRKHIPHDSWYFAQ